MRPLPTHDVMEGAEPAKISVLRLGHRRERDKRITSHLGLTARAFGADRIVLSGEEDPSALETWESVTRRFGGHFQSSYTQYNYGAAGGSGMVVISYLKD